MSEIKIVFLVAKKRAWKNKLLKRELTCESTRSQKDYCSDHQQGSSEKQTNKMENIYKQIEGRLS